MNEQQSQPDHPEQSEATEDLAAQLDALLQEEAEGPTEPTEGQASEADKAAAPNEGGEDVESGASDDTSMADALLSQRIQEAIAARSRREGEVDPAEEPSAEADDVSQIAALAEELEGVPAEPEAAAPEGEGPSEETGGEGESELPAGGDEAEVEAAGDAGEATGEVEASEAEGATEMVPLGDDEGNADAALIEQIDQMLADQAGESAGDLDSMHEAPGNDSAGAGPGLGGEDVDEDLAGAFQSPEELLGDSDSEGGGGYGAGAAEVAAELDEQPEQLEVVRADGDEEPEGVGAGETATVGGESWWREAAVLAERGVRQGCELINRPLEYASPEVREVVGWAAVALVSLNAMLVIYGLIT